MLASRSNRATWNHNNNGKEKLLIIKAEFKFLKRFKNNYILNYIQIIFRKLG